jgi:hypothetical protein
MGNFNFKELPMYKNTIMMKLLSNENLVKALANNQSNFLDYNMPEDVTTLIYSQIYPYKKATTTITDTKSYITMAFDNFRPIGGSNSVKSGRIVFFIICHNELIRTDYGLRTDYVLSEIDSIFNGLHGMGIGGLELIDAGDFSLGESSNYMAICVMYKITDFQVGVKDG